MCRSSASRIVDDAVVATTDFQRRNDSPRARVDHREHGVGAATADEDALVGLVEGDARGLLARCGFPFLADVALRSIDLDHRVAVSKGHEEMAFAVGYGSVKLLAFHWQLADEA